jgi:hypothetical protein
MGATLVLEAMATYEDAHRHFLHFPNEILDQESTASWLSEHLGVEATANLLEKAKSIPPQGWDHAMCSPQSTGPLEDHRCHLGLET